MNPRLGYLREERGAKVREILTYVRSNGWTLISPSDDIMGKMLADEKVRDMLDEVEGIDAEIEDLGVIDANYKAQLENLI